MRFASLGSGSAGNGLVVEVARTRVMLDCGFGLNDAIHRLARLGLRPDDLTGIVVTHEHADHIGGAGRFARKFKLPVWLTAGTLSMAQDMDHVEVHVIDSHTLFAVQDMTVQPFPVPHDAREPVQFVLSDGDRRLGVLTDIGASTAHVEQMLSGLQALVLETNYDRDMLWNGGYPRWLKQRIAGPFGHLDNEDSARLLAALDCSKLKHIIGAHLSESNNRPEIARAALARALGCEESWIGLATQAEGFGWRDLL